MNHSYEERFSRQTILPRFGRKAQDKLRQSSVLVVGCGGLGCPVLLYLATMGVGNLSLVDNDRVELSNLPRQILYKESDIGQLKAEAAANHIRALNSETRVHVLPIHLGVSQVRELVRQHDVVVDASDNFPTRFLLNDACVLEGKVLVHGAAGGFDGQVGVFNVLLEDGSRSPNYRDLFPVMPNPGTVPSCAEAGVLSLVPGIIGELQALEVVKVLTGIGNLLSGELLLFDALSSSFHKVRYKRNEHVRITEDNLKQFAQVLEVDWDEWVRRYSEKVDFLVDVREENELEFALPGSVHKPSSAFESWSSHLEQGKSYAFYCSTGRRSAFIIDRLARDGFQGKLIQLMGGIQAYRRLREEE